jgi:hypothetical protein
MELYSVNPKINALVYLIENEGGATVYNRPLDIINDTTELQINTKTTGYCVGNNKVSQTIPRYLEEANPVTALLLAIVAIWDKRPSCVSVGFWLDRNTGTLYVDDVRNVETLSNAMNLGATNGELAIWDVSMGREIRL